MASKESLWDLAVKQNSVSNNGSPGDRTLIVAGSKGVGKSTLIQRFLDKNEPIKTTLALEYTFGRKSGRSLVKNVCHVWELGGGILFTPLLLYPIDNVKNNNETTLVVVVDLSSPSTLWTTLETIINLVYNRFKKRAETGGLETTGYWINSDHEDFTSLQPFPVPLVIIGGKYDEFQNFDPEKRKLICRTLRTVAHYLAASLLFHSDKDGVLVKRLKDLFNYHGFGGSPWKGHCTDYNKPLAVMAGADSFEQIGVNGSSLFSQSRSMSLDKFRHTFTAHFPQTSESEHISVPDDPVKDPNFKESIIDLLRSQKDEELDRFLHEGEKRKKMAIKV